MSTDLPLGCSCGAFRGSARGVSAGVGNRIVCYCDDCQSFAHFLGRPAEILDVHGGTEIFQTSPARVEIHDGADQIACMRLTPGGLVRWYASCCRTPIGNTLATCQVPFVGLIHSTGVRTPDGFSRDEVLGPVLARVQARFAKGDRTALDAHDRAPLSLVARFAWLLLQARLRGDHRRSPFFDPRTGALRAAPHVLSPEELHQVETTRDACR